MTRAYTYVWNTVTCEIRLEPVFITATCIYYTKALVPVLRQILNYEQIVVVIAITCVN